MEDDRDKNLIFLLNYNFDSLSEESPRHVVYSIYTRLHTTRRDLIRTLYEACIAIGVNPDTLEIDQILNKPIINKRLSRIRNSIPNQVNNLSFIDEKIEFINTILPLSN